MRGDEREDLRISMRIDLVVLSSFDLIITGDERERGAKEGEG